MRRFLLIRNPKLFFKYLYAGAKSVILRWPKAPIQKRINGILFEFDFDLDLVIKLMRNPLKLLLQYLSIGAKPNVLAMYYGAYEPDTVRAMKKLLKKGDTFIDVGANIGYLSAIAMGLVGKTGQVHSFEPIPKHFQRLKNLALANKKYKIVVNQCALGEKEGTARIDVSGLSIGSSTMVPDLLKFKEIAYGKRKEMIEETIEVPTHRLDCYIKEQSISGISLIKIDTEGFEFPVLKGLSGYFENANHLPAIICEITPAAYPLLGYTLSQLSEYMKKYNYHAFSLDDTEIDITKLKGYPNVIFLS